jgi:hypothetical protein
MARRRRLKLTYSFIEDDRGVTEPYTDLPALGIMAVGLIVFSYLMLSAYSSYASSAYYASVKEDLNKIAHAVASDPSYSYRPYLLDAHMLDNASKKDFAYGYPGSAVQVIVEGPGHGWHFGRASGGKSASYMLPVSIRLNDARCVQGTLKVTMWER